MITFQPIALQMQNVEVIFLTLLFNLVGVIGR